MKQKILDIIKQKGSGFKVPAGYFEAIEDSIMSDLMTEKFPNKHGFTVPKAYFDAVEDSIQAKLTAEQLPDYEGFTAPEGYFEALEDQVFAKLSKESAEIRTSDVPDGYFDTLEDRVFARIKEENKTIEPQVITLGSRLRKVWAPVAIAASLALLIILQYNSGNEVLPGDVANAEIEAWIENDLINLDSYEIAEVFSDVDLASNESTEEEDELLDYLNGTDVESMLLEN